MPLLFLFVSFVDYVTPDKAYLAAPPVFFHPSFLKSTKSTRYCIKSPNLLQYSLMGILYPPQCDLICLYSFFRCMRLLHVVFVFECKKDSHGEYQTFELHSRHVAIHITALCVSRFLFNWNFKGKRSSIFLDDSEHKATIYIAWCASSDLGLFGCNRKLRRTQHPCQVPSVCASFVLSRVKSAASPQSFPIQLSFSLPWSCSQAWQSFTNVSAEFKVMSEHPRDFRGRFLLHTHVSFVYSWCLRSTWGSCCDVADEVMKGLWGTGWTLLLCK